ncbi:MAG TPA: protoporphyrinogen oxidase, partial [Adhaeribacter sp.]|nr:protoporphyrinogen oxidase [Adhaeribacter sp.]
KYVLEMGPASLQMCPELMMLVKELKLEKELIVPASGSQKRFVYRDGKYRPMPGSIIELLTGSFFSLKTKYQIIQERMSPPPPPEPNETVSQFFERHFGREVIDYAIGPLVTALFAGDPDQLLMTRTFPKLVEYEAEFGSVVRGLLANHAASRQQAFSFRGGLQTLTDSLASKLIGLHTGAPVEMVTKSHGKYIISSNSAEFTSSEYDVLVLALPAHKAVSLMEFTNPGLGATLQNISYPPLAVVHSVYRKADVGMPLKGFGAMHPKAEHQFTAGVIWNSNVYTSTCPANEVLFTAFVGGASMPENARKPRTEILRNVHEELKRNYDISADRPVFQHFYLWHHSLPQSDLYIEDALNMAQSMETENILVASNWFSGVSVPECVKRAGEVAKKIQALATAQSA